MDWLSELEQCGLVVTEQLRLVKVLVWVSLATSTRLVQVAVFVDGFSRIIVKCGHVFGEFLREELNNHDPASGDDDPDPDVEDDITVACLLPGVSALTVIACATLRVLDMW